jgi:AcrR family transcriptional regulator
MAAKAKPVPSVWARPSEPEQPALSRASIVREAIAMLDAEGTEALSMRKLGARLGAGATSLYRHVATKDELLERAMDEVFGELEMPHSDGRQWRTAAAKAAYAFRAMALRHPWLPPTLGQAGLVYLGPNLMSFADRLAALFTDAGFPEPGGAIDALMSYVIGMSTTEAAWLSTVARSGETEADLLARLVPAAQRAAADYTHFTQVSPDINIDPAETRERKFAYGLEVVLDGLQTRITK